MKPEKGKLDRLSIYCQVCDDWHIVKSLEHQQGLVNGRVYMCDKANHWQFMETFK